jgi:hypothetical protein
VIVATGKTNLLFICIDTVADPARMRKIKRPACNRSQLARWDERRIYWRKLMLENARLLAKAA